MNPKSHIHRYWDLRAFIYALYYRFGLVSFVSHGEHKSAILLWKQGGIIAENGIHIDIACGTKPLWIDNCFKLHIGVDLSFTAGLKINFDKVAFLCADALNLPLKNHSTNLISSLGLSEYLQLPEQFIIEIHKALIPGGFLIISFSQENVWNNIRRIWNPAIFLRNLKYWQNILTQHGFSIISYSKLPLQIQILARKNK